MQPLVSIAIPCFNAARWIRPAVKSALDQTWRATEVIIADDGSTDGSVEIVRSFGAAVTLIASDHRGGNHARNAALAQARGEWVQFLDADDCLEPRKLERQFVEAAGGGTADVIYSPTWVETVTDAGTERTLHAIDPALDLAGQWLAWQLPQTGGALWRREPLVALGGWKEDQPCCQEHELYLRAIKAQLRFVHAPTPHAVYRVWSQDTVCRKDPRLVVRVKTELMDELQTWLEERGQWTPAHARIAGRACFEMARTLAKFDLAEAVAYHASRRQRGLIRLAGPAAPLSYALIYRTFGFGMAEKLAARRRQHSLPS